MTGISEYFDFCANHNFVMPKENMLIQLIFFEWMLSKLAQKFKIVRNPCQLDISYYVWSLNKNFKEHRISLKLQKYTNSNLQQKLLMFKRPWYDCKMTLVVSVTLWQLKHLYIFLSIIKTGKKWTYSSISTFYCLLIFLI